MVKKNALITVFNAVFFNLLMKFSKIISFTFMSGSYMTFFTPAAIFMPLSGAFAGVAGSVATLALGLGLRFAFGCSFPLYLLAYHIPGFFASLYWARSSFFVRVLPAAICMALFIAHPIGAGAAFYSLFWIVPMVCAFLYSSSVFGRSLGSTFTAHAVGSVIWLYTVPMTSDAWLMLIPVVIVERILFAVAMTGAHRVLVGAFQHLPFGSMEVLSEALAESLDRMETSPLTLSTHSVPSRVLSRRTDKKDAPISVTVCHE